MSTPETMTESSGKMTVETIDSVTLKIWDRATMDQTLATAEQQLLTRAKTAECGILVTRSGPNTFKVSLCPGVPCGTTLEEVQW
jgi:hypothetical protein